ncbi:MAG TPA: endonuclease III [Lentisphaeria bacterium]|nr:MAG: endonuclease III [Lentisphaerae bacterium GWF2_50_93]HCE43172.1 endonuclease III [Lentisphaeria bacterium]
MSSKTKTPLKDWLLDIYRILEDTYGVQECFLRHEDPLQLMVSAILSAQCTDANVNRVSPGLFKKYRNVRDFAEADIKELQKDIKSIGLFRAKSKNIINACKKIMKEFGGKLPSEMEKLVTLPGIGRKTANVLLCHAFNRPGFPVDTHVQRLTNRIGFVKMENPVKIEMIIDRHLPDEYWCSFSQLLISHGRARCRARKPDCENCEIRKFCEKRI